MSHVRLWPSWACTPLRAGRCFYLILPMDPSHILIWNVRGLNSAARQDSVRVLVTLAAVDIVCLQETKMEVVTRRLILSMLGVDFDNNFVFLPSVGARGGILIAWRSKLGNIRASRINTFTVSAQFCPENGEPWWLTCVYGPQSTEDKIAFLQELRSVRANCDGPWMVAGDFNMIYRDEDKNNTNLNRAMMGRFRALINDVAIKEIPLYGRKFTWTSSASSTSPTLVKLDRVFCTVDWEENFPGLLQSTATDDSDHCPLILGLKDTHQGKRRFHFESFWPKFEGFHEAVQQAWQSVPNNPCPLETLALKFRAAARGLQSWSDKKVGHFNSQLSLAKEIVHQLEIAQDCRPLSQSELWLRNSLKKHCLALASLIRTVARLRPRIGWLKEGDANTGLFHLHAQHRKRKNFIARLTTEDQIATSHEDKAEVLLDFYTNLIGTREQRDRTIDLEALGIQHHNLDGLDDPILEEEVLDTIKHLPSDKAPGPDGFTGRFYKTCWQIIKVDVMAAISAVWRRDFRNFMLLNTAFVTLIPKKEGADHAKDFRPISLIHSFAKLIMKILADRVASRLDSMVSNNQSAFIKGRFIQDNFMLVQQTARLLHAKKQPRIMLKLDISKAFDSVSWPFLMEVLHNLGFGRVWRDILSGMLATSSTQILLNGIPGESITHRRGLRQGDPLSPMLFILVMDTLNLIISRAREDGLLQPLSSRSIQHRLSLYADDVVLFLRPAARDIDLTTNILGLFGEASGLRTNIQKSSATPIQCSAQEIETVQELMPCQVAEFRVKYLGLPLSIRKLTKAQLQPLIDRLADLLPGWKADLMTKKGRAIQVQFVLTATVMYHVMALELPPWAIKAVDKIRRGYLWRGRKEANGGHCLIAWPKVTRPKELGGLGISDLRALGWALRVRWLWLKKTEPSKPWALFDLPTSGCIEALLSMAVSTEIGDGTSTLFWKDRWLLGQRIVDLAPLISSMVPKRIANKKTVAVAMDNMDWISDIHGVASVPVILEFIGLCNAISTIQLQQGVQDKHVWRLNSSGQYSAKSAYEAIFQGSTAFEPSERIWKTWAPGKCRFFLWIAAHNRCWTADRLAKRNLPHPALCPMCDQEEENIDHILSTCVFARQFWFYFLQRMGLSSAAPQPSDTSFQQWWCRASSSVSGSTRRGLDSLIVLGAWSLWRHRNDCVFNMAEPRLATILTVAGDEATLWSMAGAKAIPLLTE